MNTSTYSLLEFGKGQRLEQWGPYRLIRPDPTAEGLVCTPSLWISADAEYVGQKGAGTWQVRSRLPDRWIVDFDDLRFYIRLSPYKHTGIFPEQQQNWIFARRQAQKQKRPLQVLNLFAYTGGASIALAKDGHFVTHVDASRPAITSAKENAVLNEIPATAIRWIVDDALTFVKRERKRGKRYDAIILDPPAYGHSPDGSAWRVERDLKPLLEQCIALLSDKPCFVILNAYGRNDSPQSIQRLLGGILHKIRKDLLFKLDAGELLLRSSDGRSLSTGIVARCGF